MRRALATLLLAAACGKGDGGAGAGSAAGSADGSGAGSATTIVVDKLEAGCAADDLESCRNLGVLYSEGAGVPKDMRRAAALLAKACNGTQGPAAPGSAGTGSAAAAGPPAAPGAATPEPPATGTGSAGTASQAGSAAAPGAAGPSGALVSATVGPNGANLAACTHLALLMSEGLGVPKDIPGAVEVYARTCDAGYGLACRNLGLMLRDGHGVPADLAAALLLLDRACRYQAPFACTNAGDTDAMLAALDEKIGGGADLADGTLVHGAVARMLNEATTAAGSGSGSGVRVGLTKAMREAATREAAEHWETMRTHYQFGCSSNEASACRQIGLAYARGTGFPRSMGAAEVWIRKACDLKDDEACRLLAPAAGSGSAQGSASAQGSGSAAPTR